MNSNLGYADIFKAVGDDTKVALIPTPDELETAYSAGRECEGGKLVNGRLVDLEYSSAALRHKPTIFRPDSLGPPFVVEPFFQDARLADLIWLGTDGEWGWSRGVGDCLGEDALGKCWTESDPLPAWESPHDFLDEGRTGICLLKKSARQLLRRAAFVRLPSWVLAEEIGDEIFPLDSWRVSGPRDDLYAEFVAEKALRPMRRRAAWIPRTIDEMPAARAGWKPNRRGFDGPWWPPLVRAA